MARALTVLAIVMLGACPRSITDSGFVLSLSPPTAHLFVEDSARFTATLVDNSGTPVPTSISWSTDNPTVATVDSVGMVRAVGSGTTTLRVSARGEMATASVNVALDTLQMLTITPANASLFVDGAQRLTATLENRQGDTLPATPEWTSSNPGVATVDGSGLVRGITTGSVTIEAKVDNIVAAAAVTVGPRPGAVTLVGAGDIASCTSGGDEKTAKLLDAIPGTVFTAGDNAYEDGSAANYASCYAPTWGRHKARTRPAPGNHEYFTFGAKGYFDYFGSAAGDRDKGGYYSYNLGGWHIIVLNSNLATAPGSPQETWLRADLDDHPLRCTLAIWHHPRFSSGPHGSSTVVQPLWQALYDAGADVVVVGHDHLYERFAPQTSMGETDKTRGIREFVVGTGGAELYDIEAVAPNSEVRNGSTAGVLKLTLYADRYDWKFVPVAGSSFTDSGSASCH